MQLESASRVADEELQHLVRNVSVVKLYYVFHGRNAWWSTWVTRYSEGCMHSAWSSVREYCESRRVQGTVFYVNELPALAFVNGARALLVTEINTDKLLGRLTGDILTTITSVLPVSSMTLKQIFYMFRATSPIWPETYPRRDSAILTYCPKATELQAVDQDTPLVARASRANGVNYYLNWSERPFELTITNLKAIGEAMNSRMNGQ